MPNRKNSRDKGKISLRNMFQELKKGDKVSVLRELSERASFPEKLQGRTGIIKGKRGRSYIIEINDQSRAKTYIIQPIHLKKLKG